MDKSYFYHRGYRATIAEYDNISIHKLESGAPTFTYSLHDRHSSLKEIEGLIDNLIDDSSDKDEDSIVVIFDKYRGDAPTLITARHFHGKLSIIKCIQGDGASELYEKLVK